MDNRLTLAVKEFAYSLGADLVGVANIERYKDAPIKMSPQGILPCAKSVIVCAVHHPDAATAKFTRRSWGPIAFSTS